MRIQTPAESRKRPCPPLATVPYHPAKAGNVLTAVNMLSGDAHILPAILYEFYMDGGGKPSRFYTAPRGIYGANERIRYS